MFDSVLASIPRVRQAGDQPQESLSSFDVFECDLCKGYMGRKGLIQCPYCGRWICRQDCWEREDLACTSCASIIRLGRDTAGMAAPLEQGDGGSSKLGVGPKLKGAVEKLKK